MHYYSFSQAPKIYLQFSNLRNNAYFYILLFYFCIFFLILQSKKQIIYVSYEEKSFVLVSRYDAGCMWSSEVTSEILPDIGTLLGSQIEGIARLDVEELVPCIRIAHDTVHTLTSEGMSIIAI